jgi:hypothetical protein
MPTKVLDQIGDMMAMMDNGRNVEAATPNAPVISRPTVVSDCDALILAAEHAVIISDELSEWAYEAKDDRDSASRWRAVAETRKMASNRFGTATHKLREQLAT